MMDITITRATVDDVPAMAEINRQAYSQELPHRFAFNKTADDQFMVRFFTGRIASRLDDPQTEIFKAVDTATGQIMGFACWTRELAEGAAPPPTGKVLQSMPTSYMNMDFIMATGAQMEQLSKCMKGEEHYYLSAFAVTPPLQGQGIGSRLLEHCLRLADQAVLPSWLISFPGSHSLYLRHGFADVDHADIDLNAWDRNRHRGFGIYRQYAMVRKPA
ncbi:acyl-CoA N-acyltransferase [Xylariomycetidae sp. FL2044]|nr:acyl-CoA N-acyltransferase [Xylariomycetidae sp. FL2044]